MATVTLLKCDQCGDEIAAGRPLYFLDGLSVARMAEEEILGDVQLAAKEFCSEGCIVVPAMSERTRKVGA